MSSTEPSPLIDLAAQYEALRNVTLGASAGINAGTGLALLIRHGVACWITAFEKGSSGIEPGQKSDGSSAVNDHFSEVIPTTATGILADMILCQLTSRQIN